MLRAVIGIVLVATVVGAMMPSRSEGDSGGNNAAAAPAEPWFAESDVSSASGSGSGSSSSFGESNGEVRLTRNSDGHFYADVQINGTPVEFMIDTGATGIAMTAADAKKAGIHLDSSERTYVGQGAGGALTGQPITLDRVKLGHRATSDMRAVVIDGASTNLLGQSFLTQFREVTVRGDVMTLR